MQSDLSLADSIIGFFSIVMVDLLLGGDNAIVIGMACRNLSPKVRLKGIVFGTMGAVVIRVLATLAIVWLLQIKFLMMIGGVTLIFVGFKLVLKEESAGEVKANASLIKAIVTVIIADAVMGIDNVLAVAGAANGSYFLVFFGLCLSIPVMVLGSTLVIKIMEKFPVIIYIGAGVIFFTAARMIIDEPIFASYFETRKVFEWSLIGVSTILELGIAILINVRKQKKSELLNEDPDQ